MNESAEIHASLDPLYHHIPQGRTAEMIGEEVGLIWAWCMSKPEGIGFLQHFEDMYQFGVFEMKGGEVLENGIYKYPEDPDLYPLIRVDNKEETVFVYPYGIVAIRNKTTRDTFVTRMD